MTTPAPTRLASFQEREAACFLSVVKRLPVALASARGSRAVDVDGRELVDLTAGWGVTSIGHCHPELVEAIAAQAGRLMQTTNIVYTAPQLDLAERLARLTGGALPRSFFVSSGAEAMDGALKLAHRATGRTRFVATRQSFHGRTLLAMSVTGQARHQDPYRALLAEQSFVPYDDLDAARAAIDERTAAFVVEPVQGEGGVNIPRPGYLAGLRAACDAAGALLVADEIQTGIGRTGRMFAWERDGAAPDVMTLAKGLGGGFPIGAFLCSEAVARTVAYGDHGGTYAGNPLACAAADAVLRTIEEEKLVQRAADLGARVKARLRAFATERPDRVADVRGLGLLLGVELRDPDRAATLAVRALERGVLINVTAGTVFRLFPALNIPEDDLFPGLESVLALICD